MAERRKFKIALPMDVWGRIIFAAQESEDWRLRTLIEQAAHEAESLPQGEFARTVSGFSFDAMRGTRFNPGDGTSGDHP